ncbi:Bax inhibitor-1/YccA family protein [Streptomyces sp. SID5789]|uniref:Bax inhibitor-1/YccA family protein n=1 Tax=Streptomyces sp. SID5789 TaxID=2690310 RepID=UPI0013693556|nr:Bax inhibitor-1/YccA family protein [Streptomyces sp. SID5789]MZE68805.1 hypothetical protein [Streptomyces sp. SID5789]
MASTITRTLKSSNPVLRQLQRSSAPTADEEAVAPSPAPSGNPSEPVVSLSKAPSPRRADTTVMTIDDVVNRTALTLGLAVAVALASWVLFPDSANSGASYGMAGAAAFIALILGLIQAFTSRPIPLLILGYAAFEGLFLGIISSAIANSVSSGAVIQAIAGTMAVFVAVLVAYKSRWIRVTPRLYRFAMAAILGFLVLNLGNWVFAAFGADGGLGFRSGGLGVLFGLAGVVIGACFLALHFKQVEDGIAAGAPRGEAWLAAFGLVVTLVWIYVEILNLFTLIDEDDFY